MLTAGLVGGGVGDDDVDMVGDVDGDILGDINLKIGLNFSIGAPILNKPYQSTFRELRPNEFPKLNLSY